MKVVAVTDGVFVMVRRGETGDKSWPLQRAGESRAHRNPPGQVRSRRGFRQGFEKMLITNLSQIAGYDIACAYGMVSTTASMTRRVLKSTMGGARTARESGSDGFSIELEEARKQAFARLKDAARDMGAHAIIGVSEQLHRVGDNGYMLLLAGTAVDLKKAEPVEAAQLQPQVVYVQATAGQPAYEPEIIEAVVRDNVIYPQFARG